MSDPYVGEIRLFGFSRVPNGWMPCDGSLQSIAEYEVLYTLIGTTYGGDGVTTFATPDLRGQVPMHWGSGPGLTPRTIGEASGTEGVTLTNNQIPAHTHPAVATSTTAAATVATGALFGGITGDTMYATDVTGLNPVPTLPTSSSTSGGNQPHDNIMPTVTVQYCIAWAGIFPQQS